MDTLPIDQAKVDRIVEEANHAFYLNMNTFKELEGNLVAAIGRCRLVFTRRQVQAAQKLLLHDTSTRTRNVVYNDSGLVPGTSSRFRCGGLSVAKQTVRLLSELRPITLVTYRERTVQHPFIDDLLKKIL